MPAARLGEDVLDRLRRLFEGFTVFDHHLRRFERFDGGVLYLAPEAPGPSTQGVSASR